MTDIQRMWLNTILDSKNREMERKERLERLRARAFRR